MDQNLQTTTKAKRILGVMATRLNARSYSVDMISALRRDYGRVQVTVLNMDLIPNSIDTVVVGDTVLNMDLFTLSIAVEGHEADGADNMHMDVEEGNDGAGKSEGKNEEKSQDDGAEQGKETKNTNSGPSYQGSKECFKPTEEDAVMFQNEQQKYSSIQATGNACLNASQEAHAFNNSVLITQDILKAEPQRRKTARFREKQTLALAENTEKWRRTIREKDTQRKRRRASEDNEDVNPSALHASRPTGGADPQRVRKIAARRAISGEDSGRRRASPRVEKRRRQEGKRKENLAHEE
jgi:hypothetical protein